MAEKNKAPLSVRGLCKHYPGFDLKDVSFELEPGTITGFVGRNGAGKTTTLNSILGFVHPDAGEVRFGGLDMAHDAAQIKADLGFVSAGMSFYTRKKLSAITAVTRSFCPRWDDGAYRRWMERFGLDEGKTPAALSNGMKIKYALALALSHGARLFILDEPTSGLDPVSREELVEILLALRDEGRTILFSTHITGDLEKCADRVIYLRKGEVAADMPLQAFADAWRIVECPGEIPPAVQAAMLGSRRARNGWTALVPRETDLEPDLTVRVPTLDEIMAHMEKEGEA